MALNRVLQKWVWRPVMLRIIVMSLHSFIFIFRNRLSQFFHEQFFAYFLSIKILVTLKCFFSSVPQHLRRAPWEVVDLEQSIPPTREFPKTISSIKQTNLWDEENLLPNTSIINTWMRASVIVILKPLWFTSWCRWFFESLMKGHRATAYEKIERLPFDAQQHF